MGKTEKIIAFSLLGLVAVSAISNIWIFYVNNTLIGPGQGGQYIEGLIGQPRLINPLFASSGTDLTLSRLVFSGLYKYNSQGGLVPDLAESLPVISSDQNEYTVTLRQNAQWHDSRPVTADDVVFTVKTIQDPAYKSPLRNKWLNTTVEKRDNHTIVFINKDVYAPFVNNLTLPIAPEHIWSKISTDSASLSSANLEAIGSGPYMIREIKKLPSGQVTSISLDSNKKYYGQVANIDTLRFNFYETNDDLINAFQGKEIEGLGYLPLDRNLYIDQDRENLTVLRLPIPQYEAVFFNLSNKILSDRNVRQALLLATNKDQIVQEVFGGNARSINEPFLPEQIGFIENPKQPTNLEAAKALLDQAGWRVGSGATVRSKNNTNFEITLATSDFALNANTAENLSKQWQALQINVKVNVFSNKELTDNIIRPRQFDALVLPQKLDSDPDPFVFWHSSQNKNPGVNVTGFSNAEADKLMSEARATTDAVARTQKYQRISQLISEGIPAIFLNQSVYIYALDKKIQGTSLKTLLDASQRVYDIPQWYISTARSWK